MNKLFTIYRSSAGSGKTRTLAREYLKLCLNFRAGYFRHILAVTFANKATQEMKDRTLAYLDAFASGRPNELADELKTELNLDDATFRERSRDVQISILHQYSQFSISTIDAFFQRVIRSFTRESELMGDYRLEVEQDMVLEEVIDNLIDELGSNEELTNWVVEFARENLENERAWDVRYNLVAFANEIFKEDFRNIEEEVIKTTGKENFFPKLLKALQERKWSFVRYISGQARKAMNIIDKCGFEKSEFKYNGNPGYTFFERLTSLTKVRAFGEPGKQIVEKLVLPQNWPNDKTPNKARIIEIAAAHLLPVMQDILSYRDKFFAESMSAEVALNNFYSFGLIADISRKLKEYKHDNNIMLLADAPKLLNGIIDDSDTPFIYEKVGSFYKNYLIDEFQDTSGLQWKNFLPLLTNNLDQGYSSLVVGDVKQAIYRWRGGDLNLLQQEVEHHIGKERVEVKELTNNFRSASHVVEFNNKLFRSAVGWLTGELGFPVSEEVYKDVEQKVSTESDGFVHVKFIREESKEQKWKDESLKLLTQWIEDLQQGGIPLKDIAILVRKNDEGQQIADHLLRYRNSPDAKPDCRYDVISNESLRLDGAASVNLLLSAMRYVLNTGDGIARAQLAYEYARLSGNINQWQDVFSVSDKFYFENDLPDAFGKEKASLRKLSLYELTERLIQIFHLGHEQGELVYIQAFQDIVLDFGSRERNDLGMFLEWWENNKHKKFIQLSGEVDALQIVTIHKSKGLQFKYVFIPFCAWNLDHDGLKAPNLWVKSDKPLFKEAGYLPVKYSSSLEQTYFSKFYQEEHARCYLDNLNLLYVALTRAEMGLIIHAPHLDLRIAKNSVAQVLYESIQQEDRLQSNWKDAAQVWQTGEWKGQESVQSETSNSITLQTYASSFWRDKLVIRKSAGGFFEPGKEEVRRRMNYGIYIHTVLSRIKYSSDIGKTLDELIGEGYLQAQEKQPLSDQLERLFEDEQVRSWFSPPWEVRTEVYVLLPGGMESRIDRLLINEGKAVIVDFKTGDPSKADQRQVLEYMNTLHQMNYTVVEGYLLYTNLGEIVPVKSGRVKSVRKKDINQLDLGL